MHFALGERLGLPALVQRILALPRDDRWQTMARAALRDDLHAVHAQLTAQVLAATSPEDSAPARIAAWEDGDERRRAAAAAARSRRSAPTTRPTWRGSPSGCGWCAGCWPPAEPRPGRHSPALPVDRAVAARGPRGVARVGL